MKRPRQVFDMVEVVWVDAAAQENNWKSAVTVEPALVISVGFLVLRDKGHIVIAQDLDSDGGNNGRTQIPTGMVQTIKVLRKKDVRLSREQ
jgi:hypothetical protein